MTPPAIAPIRVAPRSVISEPAARGGQLPPLAGLEATEPEPGVARAVQVADPVADRLEHPLGLMVAALVEGELEAVTLRDGERLSFTTLFLFLGAAPCTDWLGDVVERDDKGFVLTGADARADGLLETSVPGIYAAGDVRSGSIKRCATAVGEGAMVVRFVHEHLSGVPA